MGLSFGSLMGVFGAFFGQWAVSSGQLGMGRRGWKPRVLLDFGRFFDWRGEIREFCPCRARRVSANVEFLLIRLDKIGGILAALFSLRAYGEMELVGRNCHRVHRGHWGGGDGEVSRRGAEARSFGFSEAVILSLGISVGQEIGELSLKTVKTVESGWLNGLKTVVKPREIGRASCRGR